jgi:hypothetical protein
MEYVSIFNGEKKQQHLMMIKDCPICSCYLRFAELKLQELVSSFGRKAVPGKKLVLGCT